MLMMRPNRLRIMDLAAARVDKRCPQVHGQDLVELLVRHADQQVVPGDPRIVDEDSDAAVLVGQRFEHLGEFIRLRDIHAPGHDLKSGLLDRPLQVPELVLDDIQARHDPALLEQLEDNGPPDAPGGPGDYRKSFFRHDDYLQLLIVPSCESHAGQCPVYARARGSYGRSMRAFRELASLTLVTLVFLLMRFIRPVSTRPGPIS